jgi:peptidoglycan hydrolase-like protein with peptidoglycan-binding domain
MKRFLTLLALALVLLGGLIPSTASAQGLDNSPDSVPSRGPSFDGPGLTALLSNQPAMQQAAPIAPGKSIAMSPAAAAAPLPQVFINKVMGMCLDSNANREVYVHICNGGLYQKWTVQSNSTIRNVATGLCLAADQLGKAYTWPCDQNPGLWTVLRNSGGTLSFAKQATGWCLDNDGGTWLFTSRCSADILNQKWDDAWPDVRRGETSYRVRIAQYLLNAQGANLAVDGIFGPATESAVRSFQINHGLPVDGIVGPNTWPKLIIPIRQGNSGSAVRAAQAALNAHGYSLAVDGSFGPATNNAVRSYQSYYRLTIDGIVGPQTWRKLAQ